MRIFVSAVLHIRIKGTRGEWITRAGEEISVDERGIRDDRRWVVVDENGMFVAQRSSGGLGIEVLSMCQISTNIEGDTLVLKAPGMSDFRLPYERAAAPIVFVQVWSSASLMGIDEGGEVSAWLTKFLSRERSGTYRLIRMAKSCRRRSKTGDETIMGFHDGFPFMGISDSSLGGLNGRLIGRGKDVVLMNQFRPSIVFSGCDYHAEDFFDRFRIGNVEFAGGTLCDRCAVIRTDQTTAIRHKSEPTATLATYRKGVQLTQFESYRKAGLGIDAKPNAIFFGRNFNHLNSSTFRIGDTVEML